MNRRRSVGFDRPIKLEWLDAVAAKVAEGASPPEVRKFLYSVLEGEVSGNAKNSARGKTVTVLSHIWCLVPDSATDIRGRAAVLLSQTESQERLAVHWAMMIATYPFFTDVVSLVGRLLSLHGSVGNSQIKKRMAELWGERSTIEIAIPRIVQSMVRWGALTDTDEKGVFKGPDKPTPVSGPVAELLIEALLIDSDQEFIEVGQLLGHAALFPFGLSVSSHQLRALDHFRLSRQGLDQEFIGLFQEKKMNRNQT